MALTKISGSILKDPLNLGEVSIGGTLTYQDVTNVDSVGIVTARQGIHIDDSIVHIGDTNTKIRFPANDTISFETSGNEKVRIDSEGRILSRHSASRTVGTKTGQLQVIESFNNAAISIIQTNNAASAPFLAFGKTRSANDTGSTIVQNNDSLGQILFCGADGTDVDSIGAWILAQVDGTPDINDMPGRLIFSTSSAGSPTPTERLRITSAGAVMINKTTSFGTVPLQVKGTSSELGDGSQIFDIATTDGSTGTRLAFGVNEDNFGWIRSYESGVGGRDLVLAASDEKMRIKSDGKVGIGTITPTVLTHIYDSTNTSPATEQFRISGGNRTADTFETGFRFFTQSPSANGNRHIVFTSNGNTGLVIQPYETSTGNAATDRVISLCPSGGSVNIGDNSTQTSRSLAVTGSVLFKSSEADIWMESTGPNGVWRILGSTGGNTHQFRIYDNTNAADRLIIDSNGRVVIGDTSTTNASTHADNLVVSGSGNIGITIASTNSSDSNLFFSDGSSGSAPYAGYVQYSHSGNQLVFGANGALRSILYDKDGGTNHSVLLIGGGGTSNNHYNSISNASITFGGGNDIENYFLGVRRENYGGDYTKLDLRWHTGIRIGAQSVYGGVRFFNDEDLDSVKFSIMGGGDHVEAHTTFRPGLNNNYNCGTSGRRWAQIWYYNANSTSDRNEKNTIKESDLGLDFICKLKPVSYKWNQREGENADTKTHYGLISQDVEEAVIESKKTLDDFGAIVKPEGDDPMGLSYHEFISPLVKAMQEQQEQIETLKAEVAALKSS